MCRFLLLALEQTLLLILQGGEPSVNCDGWSAPASQTQLKQTGATGGERTLAFWSAASWSSWSLNGKLFGMPRSFSSEK